MMRPHTAPEKQQSLSLETGGEVVAGSGREDTPVVHDQLMERVLERDNLRIPTVLDRLIQQALLQVLQAEWDRSFSHSSYGFRPGRSAHQAIEQAQRYINDGYRWTVDMDLEKFFDRVNHDKLMRLVKRRVTDERVLKLINSYLKAGALVGDIWAPASEGTPQGGPLSPLLANVLLDELDRELERRGHRFVRYADDCNIYVNSQRSGQRVLARLTGYLRRRLKLVVNEEKSAVGRPWERVFLGFTFTRRGWEKRRKVSDDAIKQFKYRVRSITRRTRGRAMQTVIGELAMYLRGWKGYYGFAQVKSPIQDLEKWVRR